MSDYQRRAKMFGAEFIDLSTVRFTPELLRRIPAELVRKYRVLPLGESESHFKIVIADPSDLNAIDTIHLTLGRDIEVCAAAATQIDALIQRFYGDDKLS